MRQRHARGHSSSELSRAPHMPASPASSPISSIPYQEKLPHHTSTSTRRGPCSTSTSTGTGPSKKLPISTPTLLQPRIAAVLGLPTRWQLLLFACRLLSIGPAIFWGLPVAIRFLLLVHDVVTGRTAEVEGDGVTRWSFENRLVLTERVLALLWCGCSAYLSFIFTDCLMSRWLVNYTPQATMVRLIAINALNSYLQSWLLHPRGTIDGPLLLLLKWIGITSALTVTYHFTQRKTRIRKETFISISVFSVASYISMFFLLVLVHWERTDWQEIRLLAFAEDAWWEGKKLATRVVEYIDSTNH